MHYTNQSGIGDFAQHSTIRVLKPGLRYAHWTYRKPAN